MKDNKVMHVYIKYVLMDNTGHKKRVLKERQNYTENKQNFWNKWNMIFTPTLKIFCPTRWTVQAASLRTIMKNGTRMKPRGWAQKARIIGVETKIQTFSFFYRLQFAIVAFSHSDNLSSSLQRAELYAVDAQKDAKLSATVLRGMRSDRNASLY